MEQSTFSETRMADLTAGQFEEILTRAMTRAADHAIGPRFVDIAELEKQLDEQEANLPASERL